MPKNVAFTQYYAVAYISSGLTYQFFPFSSKWSSNFQAPMEDFILSNYISVKYKDY